MAARPVRAMGVVAIIALCAVLSPFLLLAAVLYLALLFLGIITGLSYVGAGLARLRFHIWRITR